jgi:hypothetical protein
LIQYLPFDFAALADDLITDTAPAEDFSCLLLGGAALSALRQKPRL